MARGPLLKDLGEVREGALQLLVGEAVDRRLDDRPYERADSAVLVDDERQLVAVASDRRLVTGDRHLYDQVVRSRVFVQEQSEVRHDRCDR